MIHFESAAALSADNDNLAASALDKEKAFFYNKAVQAMRGKGRFSGSSEASAGGCKPRGEEMREDSPEPAGVSGVFRVKEKSGAF